MDLSTWSQCCLWPGESLSVKISELGLYSWFPYILRTHCILNLVVFRCYKCVFERTVRVKAAIVITVVLFLFNAFHSVLPILPVGIIQDMFRVSMTFSSNPFMIGTDDNSQPSPQHLIIISPTSHSHKHMTDISRTLCKQITNNFPLTKIAKHVPDNSTVQKYHKYTPTKHSTYTTNILILLPTTTP